MCIAEKNKHSTKFVRNRGNKYWNTNILIVTPLQPGLVAQENIYTAEKKKQPKKNRSPSGKEILKYTISIVSRELSHTYRHKPMGWQSQNRKKQTNRSQSGKYYTTAGKNEKMNSLYEAKSNPLDILPNVAQTVHDRVRDLTGAGNPTSPQVLFHRLQRWELQVRLRVLHVYIHHVVCIQRLHCTEGLMVVFVCVNTIASRDLMITLVCITIAWRDLIIYSCATHYIPRYRELIIN